MYPHLRIPCPFNLKTVSENGINTLIPVQVNEKNKTVKLLNDTGLNYLFNNTAYHIWANSHLIGQFQNNDALNMSTATIRDAIQAWLHSEFSLLKEKVKPFAFKSDPGYAYARAEFDPVDYWQDTPTFNQLINNFSNSEPLMAFIGSLFFLESYMQQYVWIYGEGGNGKGALIRAIRSVFGDAFHSSSYVPTKEDKYWTYELIGKRFVVFPDCNAYHFVTTGLFKSLTGDDSVRVEEKFKNAYSVHLKAKYMFHSNETPKISSNESDLRRIIFSEAKNKEAFEPDPEFELKLKDEVPAFISNCILKYQQLCPKHGPIPVDKVVAASLAIQNEEAIHAFIEHYFEAEIEAMVPAAKVHQLLETHGRHIYKPQFFKVLARDYNSVSKPKWYEGKTTRVYDNLKLAKHVFS